jgi:outer membrane protein OmpA-like peptidoglycan-associated protein
MRVPSGYLKRNYFRMKKSNFLFVSIFLGCIITGFAQNKTIFEGVNLTVEDLSVNTATSDFGPAIIGNELLFSSFNDENPKAIGKKSFYDLFSSDLDANGNILNERKREISLISEYHEGPLSFCEKTGELFLSQSNYEDPETQNIVFQKKNIRLGIVVYKKSGAGWVFSEKFPYNDKTYSIAHPTISQGGDTLVFTSDMPGGFGETDLYMSVRENGKWSKPQNLGNKINTPGKEMFPFLTNNGILIFSSDGHGGSGKLDLFHTAFPVNSSAAVVNFGSPINSDADDFGLVVHPSNMLGYFASNRSGGKGDDDIYCLRVNEFKFDLITMSSYTKKFLPETNVKIADSKGKTVFEGKTDVTGLIVPKLKVGDKYVAKAVKDGYAVAQKDIDLSSLAIAGSHSEEIYLDPDFLIEGQVVNILGGAPVPDARIIINSENAPADTLFADLQGEFSYNVQPGKKYNVEVGAKNFFGTEVDVSTEGMEPGSLAYLFELYSLDAGSRIELKNIYYDYNKWDIRPDAAKELDRLVDVMNQYPNLEIKLESHTDSRGTAEYNMELSGKRAQSSFEYLVAHGIDAKRIQYVGLGESQLVNRCRDGVNCSEEEHAQNRRTVVEILKSKVTQSRRSKVNIFYF